MLLNTLTSRCVLVFLFVRAAETLLHKALMLQLRPLALTDKQIVDLMISAPEVRQHFRSSLLSLLTLLRQLFFLSRLPLPTPTHPSELGVYQHSLFLGYMNECNPTRASQSQNHVKFAECSCRRISSATLPVRAFPIRVSGQCPDTIFCPKGPVFSDFWPQNLNTRSGFLSRHSPDTLTGGALN